MTFNKKPVCLITTTLLLISCGEGGSSDTSSESTNELQILSQCAMSSCQADKEACRASMVDQCSRCWEASSDLVSSGGGFYDCVSICDSSSCQYTCPPDDSCQEYEFVASLPEQRDEALYQACLQAQARNQRCGLSETFGNCDAFARLERAEAAKVYACYAQAPCDTLPPCNDLPPTGVAQRYCDGFQQICGATPEACDDPAQLDAALFNWQKDQVNDEILRCLERDCEAALACINAYLEALQ